MKSNELAVTIKSNDPVKAFFEIMAPMFKLTPKETEVLSVLYKLDPKLPARGDDRKKAVKILNLKNTNVLAPYIQKFVEKKALTRTGKSYRFHPLLEDASGTATILFKIVGK